MTEQDYSSGNSRRSFLKTTGLAVGAGLTGLGAASNPATAKQSISADMVDPDKPETAEKFVKRTLRLGDTDSVTTAYQDLSDTQLDAVRDAVERLSEWTLETPSDDGFSTMAVPISKTATLTKTIAGVTVHETTHTVEFESDLSNDTLSNASHSSTGSAPAPLWHHNGLYSTYLTVQDGNSEVFSSRSHEYTHSVGGQTIVHEAAVIDISGTAGGSFDVTKNVVSL